MASTQVVLAGILLIGLLTLGVYQTVSLPHSTLANAVVLDDVSKSQHDINLCMNDCMRACVTDESKQVGCLDECDKKCGA